MTIFSESSSLEGLTPDDIIPESTVPDFEYSSPIVQRELPLYLDDFTNLTFTGSVKPNDDRSIPSIGFITVYRDDKEDGEIAHYYNGYGIAIRPSLDANQLNVFVVDNALAVQDVLLENVLHTGWGDYAYLAATHVDIDYEKTYNFRLDIGDGNTLSFYIWETGSAFPGIANLTYGSYIPISDGRSYGVSCSNTGGYQWKWDNLSLSHKTSNHPIEVYEFDVSSFTEDFSIKAAAWGSGYDGTVRSYGIIMYAWNYSTSSWDELDDHDFGESSSNITLASNDLDINKYSDQDLHAPKATIALVTKYPSSFSNSIDSTIEVDYIKLECWDSASAHVGGMGDVYVKINGSPTENYIDIDAASAKEWIIPNNGSISGDLQLPIIWIRSIQILDASGEPSGISLTPSVEWSFVVDSEEKRFSSKEENYIIFSGAALGSDLRVNYYSYPSIESMQDYCDTEILRNVTDDYLVKSYLPCELFMDISYSGSLNPITARNLLSQWINNGTKKALTTTDIAIKLMEDDEVSYATASNMRYISHDKDGGTTQVTGDTLTLSSREHFILIPDATHMDITVS